MYKRNILLYILKILLLILLSYSPVFAQDQNFDEEFLRLESKDPKMQAVKENVEIRITKKGDYYHWFEKREIKNVGIDTFEVVFDKVTLIPTSYLRVIKIGDTTQEIKIQVGKEQIAADITDSQDGKSRQSIPIPRKRFIIEPFLKLFVANQVGQGTKSGDFQMVTLIEGKLKNFGVEWKTLGQEKVNTAAGTFNCFKTHIAPSSWLIRAVAPPAICWFDASGTHKIIRAQGKRKRFENEKITDLVKYTYNGKLE